MHRQTWKRSMHLSQNCTTMRQLKTLHANFIVHGFHRNNYAMSKLITFCALSSSGNLSYASHLFSRIETPNSFIYNDLIKAYSRSPNPHLAIHYFNLLSRDCNAIPDHHTFHFAILACANGCLVLSGRNFHSWVCKNGLVFGDGYIQTAVLRIYVQGREMDDARKLFDEIPSPDVVKWNVLINGYVLCGLENEALRVFQDMLVLGVEPDEFNVTTALSACAQAGALLQGKWIHEYVKKRRWLEFDVVLGTALVDMYAKCGCVDMAVEVFERMPKRNAFSWAAMIRGFAIHGFARKAIDFLQRMQLEDGVRPDRVVLLGVLTACTHAGLQEEGQFLLDNMKARYGILPKHEHYSCVVDLLCRAGKLNEALALISRMPMKPLASVWGALLSSCRTHKNSELAEIAVKELLELESSDGKEEDGALVQLSNIYMVTAKSKDAHRIRRLFGDRGLKKTPGCSMIEVDGMVNEFVSGDVSHKDLAQIHATLELMVSDLFT